MKKNINKRKKKLNIVKIIIFILIIVVVVHFYNKIKFYFSKNGLDISNINISNEYKVIKLDYNENYSGIGQEKIKNKDGYFTTFTTENKYKKTYKEYKQNGNASWSNKEYWGGTMTENGCGITAMAIILSGYGKDFTPDDLRKKYLPVIDYNKLSSEFSSKFGIENSDFYYDSIHLSAEKLQEHLRTDRPILICVWNKPKENRWTSNSHYMVLLATDENNLVYVSNPNGGENDSKSSGWYDINEITPYLAKALYIESYKK